MRPLDAVGDVLSRIYYSDCELSSVITGSVFTCDLAAINCRPVSLRASFVCVSSLVVSRRHHRLYWSDVGLGLIASASLNDSSSRVRCLRSVLSLIALTNFKTSAIN